MRVLVVLPLLLTACGTAPQGQGVVECQEEILAFAVPGRLAEVPAIEGAGLTANAPVARLEGTDQRLALAQAEAALALAQARRAQLGGAARPELRAAAEARAAATATSARLAKADLERQEQLLALGQASSRERDRAAEALASAEAAAETAHQEAATLAQGGDAAALAVADAEVALARTALATAQDALAKTTLLSPPGPRIVRSIHRHPGEWVPAGTPVATVADLSRPYVDAFVPQAQAARLTLGQGATVRVDGQPPLAGTVERIGERLEYTPRFLFGPADRPHLMLRVRVRLAGPAPAAGVPADVTFATP